SDVLRIEPSAYLTPDEIEHAVAGLRALCRALAAGDLFELTRHLATRGAVDPGEFAATPPFRTASDPPPAGAVRVGFVFPLLHPDAEVLAVAPAVPALAPHLRAHLIRRRHLL